MGFFRVQLLTYKFAGTNLVLEDNVDKKGR